MAFNDIYAAIIGCFASRPGPPGVTKKVSSILNEPTPGIARGACMARALALFWPQRS